MSAGLRGFVEARADGAILGWAWDPARPSARLTVVLRDGEAEIARALADLPRDDLARSGIGDGAHAFRFDLPPGQAARLDAIAVLALAADGGAVPLDSVPPPPGLDSLPLIRLQRGLQRLAEGQRAILAAMAPGPEATGAPALLHRIAAAQEATARQVETVEVFVNRLDERLAALAATPAPPRLSPATLLLAALFGAAAAAAMTLALRHLG
ncbi:hypothetical protein [Paracraurococcus ruber]|nr:hypothetical protein [Paracraurococcus ruber]TDG16400.1 hypothetical protein E2C05_29270 [Paracraurococcus ruber]